MNRHSIRALRWRTALRQLVAIVSLALSASILMSTPPAGADLLDVAPVLQPAPPTSGPGSVDFKHRGWKVRLVGHGFNAAYVFEPTRPKLDEAPLAIITHGYFEFSGYDQMYELVRHTVLAGNVVIYPRYQTSATGPCPGPFNIEPCMDAATKGIRKGLRFLADHRAWTQPLLDRTSYFGFSFGGIITANLANRWQRLNLPEPRAIFLDDPHDGGFAGTAEPALDSSLAGIPKTTRIECHSGADGVLADKPDSSCNAVFPRLTTVPRRNKSLVMTHTDSHGQPALSSDHGVCAGGPGTADAYDWNFCWKVWDALRATAYTGKWRQYAFGDSAAHTSLGTWSDGVPVLPLEVAAAAPVLP